MPELNKANRQVCDVDIRILKTMAPFLKFDTANTTTAGLTGDSAYAMAKGSRRIAFANPLEGTMTIEAQVYPFKFFSLLSDGVIETSAAYADTQIVTCTKAGELALTVDAGKEIKAGTVFVYPEGQFGDEDAVIVGTFATEDAYVVADTYVAGTTYYTESSGTYSEATGITSFTAGTTYYTKVVGGAGKFTATTAGDIAVDSKYEVGYIVTRTTGVKRISFNNKKLPKDYFITMKTVDKDEEGLLTPFIMTSYKASIQRSFELSFSSEGDPANVTLTFDLMEDKDGNIFDMVELTDDAE